MDANTVMTLVSTLGFPIVACGACGAFVKYMYDTMMKKLDDESRRHAEEMKTVVDALNNNTLAVTMLTERLKRED